MWQKVSKFKGAEYFRKALYMYNNLPCGECIGWALWSPRGKLKGSPSEVVNPTTSVNQQDLIFLTLTFISDRIYWINVPRSCDATRLNTNPSKLDLKFNWALATFDTLGRALYKNNHLSGFMVKIRPEIGRFDPRLSHTEDIKWDSMPLYLALRIKEIGVKALR